MNKQIVSVPVRPENKKPVVKDVEANNVASGADVEKKNPILRRAKPEITSSDVDKELARMKDMLASQHEAAENVLVNENYELHDMEDHPFEKQVIDPVKAIDQPQGFQKFFKRRLSM